MVYAYSPSSSSLGGLSLLLLTLLSCIWIDGSTMIVNAQNDCSTYDDSCNGCIENSPCVWVPEVGCIESCDLIADTSCYSPQYFTNNVSLDEICTIATNDVSNYILCDSQIDCTSCVDTLLSGTTDTCQWFKSDNGTEGYCGHECGMSGCGELTCDDGSTMVDDDGVTVVDNDDRIISNCEINISCRDCLSASSTACGWVSGMGCLESCNVIADVGCYDIENFNRDPNVLMTGDDICTVASNDIADMDLCNSQTDCTTCIEASLASSSSDPSNTASTCRWFSDGNFCGSECNMIGCGETTCTVDSYNIGDVTIVDAGSIIDNGSVSITGFGTGTPPSSVDAVVSSTAAKKEYNYFLVWTAAILMAVASCLL
jgi:hypothetical protein